MSISKYDFMQDMVGSFAFSHKAIVSFNRGHFQIYISLKQLSSESASWMRSLILWIAITDYWEH